MIPTINFSRNNTKQYNDQHERWRKTRTTCNSTIAHAQNNHKISLNKCNLSPLSPSNFPNNQWTGDLIPLRTIFSTMKKCHHKRSHRELIICSCKMNSSCATKGLYMQCIKQCPRIKQHITLTWNDVNRAFIYEIKPHLPKPVVPPTHKYGTWSATATVSLILPSTSSLNPISSPNPTHHQSHSQHKTHKNICNWTPTNKPKWPI